ncbi:MFS transporter [Rubeoparvulum massiliense]|uniref:MFS transporter n=1 Tax=Rubeoparvulum massiliense TaxID=1631346 RepID=UPI00065E3D22|nr:MFS transporter [Rubeoparvulum massiliense]
MSEHKSVFEVFKNLNYRKLFFAMFTQQFGSVVGMMAFTFYLLDHFAEQPRYVTITELMFSIPTLLLFFIVGVVADRFDRLKIAYSSDWIRAGITLLMILAIYLQSIPFFIFLLFLRSSVAKFFIPAEAALVQGILKDDEFTSAAGLNQMMGSIFNIFGIGIAALLYRSVGIYGTIILDALCFCISGILIHSCRIPKEVRLPNGKSSWNEFNVKSVLHDFKNGLQYILHYPLLRNLMIGFFFLGIVNGGFSVAPQFYLRYEIANEDTYQQFMAILGIIFGIGILIGSIIASKVAQRVQLHIMLIGGLIGSGLAVFIMSIASWLTNSDHILFSLGGLQFSTTHLFFFSGTVLLALCLAFCNVGLGGWLPRVVDKNMMGRVQGWIDPLIMLAHTATLGVILLIYPLWVPTVALFYIISGALLLSGIFYLIKLPHLVKYSEKTPEIAEESAPVN